MICLASGIVLTFQYRPMGNVFQNVEEITTTIPYGWFFRQLHYGSGQAFVVLMLIHALDHFVQKRYRRFPPGQWILLVLSLALCFYTLFTGFLLKGDQEGVFAARIFMNMMGTIPILGEGVSRLFIVPGDGFLFLPYLYHCFWVPILILVLLRSHIREWFPDTRLLLLGGTLASLYALFVKPGLALPPDAPTPVVAGPWFFLGIQTLLKVLPPFLAGIVIPGSWMGCLLLIPFLHPSPKSGQGTRRVRKAAETVLYRLLIVAILLYGGLTLRAAIGGP